jgi:hypothetical protein
VSVVLSTITQARDGLEMGGSGLDRGHGGAAFTGDRPGARATTAAPFSALVAMTGYAAMLVTSVPVVA